MRVDRAYRPRISLDQLLLHLVVRLTYVAGHESEAADYERTVLDFFKEHGGVILAAFRPAPWDDGTRAADEIQVLRIPSRERLDAYMNDERRLALAEVRARAIASTEVVMSEETIAY